MIKEQEKLLELKRNYLLDERGMLRPGFQSMKMYSEIYYAETEEELEATILRIMEENPNDQEIEIDDEGSVKE